MRNFRRTARIKKTLSWNGLRYTEETNANIPRIKLNRFLRLKLGLFGLSLFELAPNWPTSNCALNSRKLNHLLSPLPPQTEEWASHTPTQKLNLIGSDDVTH
jgi:hypothetical protein